LNKVSCLLIRIHQIIVQFIEIPEQPPNKKPRINLEGPHTKELVSLKKFLEKVISNVQQTTYSDVRLMRKKFFDLPKDRFNKQDRENYENIKVLLMKLTKVHPELCNKDHFIKSRVSQNQESTFDRTNLTNESNVSRNIFKETSMKEAGKSTFDRSNAGGGPSESVEVFKAPLVSSKPKGRGKLPKHAGDKKSSGDPPASKVPDDSQTFKHQQTSSSYSVFDHTNNSSGMNISENLFKLPHLSAFKPPTVNRHAPQPPKRNENTPKSIPRKSNPDGGASRKQIPSTVDQSVSETPVASSVAVEEEVERKSVRHYMKCALELRAELHGIPPPTEKAPTSVLEMRIQRLRLEEGEGKTFKAPCAAKHF
jgi:hypothetical protein